MNDLKFIIDSDVLQAVGNYLSTRPWAEVHELIDALRKLEVYKQEAPSPEEE